MRCLVAFSTISWAYAFRFSPTVGLSPLLLRRGSVRRFAVAGEDRPAPLTAEVLSQRAIEFVSHKNAAGRGDNNLEPVFAMMCSSNNAEIYGLVGEKIRPGLTAFFAEHTGLHHELTAEPTCVGPATVQYPFVKSWRADDGKWQRWSSIDPAKLRNKVERLCFDGKGMLVRVAVVEATSPVMPI